MLVLCTIRICIVKFKITDETLAPPTSFYGADSARRAVAPPNSSLLGLASANCAFKRGADLGGRIAAVATGGDAPRIGELRHPSQERRGSTGPRGSEAVAEGHRGHGVGHFWPET